MQFKIIEDLNEIPAEDWNRLSLNHPFLSHQFLSALEKNHCVGEMFGWWPQHIVVFKDCQLIAAMPLYKKNNSYGELVFDWGWADAYHRHGLAYYPKLVNAIPYTPATGPRILFDANFPQVVPKVIENALDLAHHNRFSSYHCLFPELREMKQFEDFSMFHRLGCQYHWHNQGFGDFDDFLSTFTSKKRKNIKSERKKISQTNIKTEILHGDELEPHLLKAISRHYEQTFHHKGGIATLNSGFFSQVAHTMGPNMVVMLAYQNNQAIASAICFRSDEVLYGRHWGCDRLYDFLHFELCYYLGIEYCIKHKLKKFEPGAQGEYKISRGFEPTETWSSHWIAHPSFRQSIQKYVMQEQVLMREHIQTLRQHLPFKTTNAEE